MSLWTPSGEHRVDPTAKDAPTTPTAPTAPGPDPGEGEAGPSLEDLSPEQRAQVEEMARQMDAARARMLQMPVGAVVGRQAAPFADLAGIYLSEQPPRLADARIAIDALAAIIEKLGPKLGETEQELRHVLNQLQLAFVELSKDPSGSE